MASEIRAAYAHRILNAILALERATIIDGVPFGAGRERDALPLPTQILAAHADALDTLREALSAFEAAISALQKAQPQDRARSRALEIRTAALIRRQSGLLERIGSQTVLAPVAAGPTAPVGFHGASMAPQSFSPLE